MKITYANILVADDDNLRRASLAETLLQWERYTISVADSVEKAMELLHMQPVDLILIHVGLAGQDDSRFLRQLSSDGRIDHIPVIILASQKEEAAAARCLEMGATDFLFIPPFPPLLKARIHANLEKKQLQTQFLSCLQAFDEMERLADDLRLVILPLGIALSSERDFDRLLERIVVEAKAICNADAGILYLRTDEGALQYAITRNDSLRLAQGGITGQPPPYRPLPLRNPFTGAPNDRHVATYVALWETSINIPDVYESVFDFTGTMAFDKSYNYRTVSCLTVPLKNEEVLGVLQLLNAQDKEGNVIPFSLYHELVAESLASQAAIVLHNRMLRQKQQTLLEVQRDLEIGRQIQEGFFPADLIQPEGWEVVARFHPAREVSGDFYDVFPIPGQKIGLVVADVCDKGVGAALFMALVRSLIRAFIQQFYFLERQHDTRIGRNITSGPFTQGAFRSLDRRALLDSILLTNSYIGSNHGQMHMFATLFFGMLDPVTGELIYVNCGHNPPIVVGDKEGVKRRLDPTGPAVGLRPDATYVVSSTRLKRGDIMLAYTDGVTEARNEEGKMFLELRLLSAVSEKRVNTAVELLDHVDAQVENFVGDAERSDDIALLAVRFKPSA